MASILDYLDWRGDITFAERPFNEVDNLLLAELSYLDFDGIVPADFAAAVPLPDAVAAFTKRTPHAEMGVLVPDKIPGLRRLQHREILRILRLRAAGNQRPGLVHQQDCGDFIARLNGACFLISATMI